MGKIIKNIGWLIFDRIFILVLQFFIGVKIANYYGSSSYGIYSFAVSIVAFSAIFFEILNSRVIKKYYDEENYHSVVYNVTFFRNMIAIVLFFFALVVGKFLNIDRTLYIILVLLCVDNILTTSTTGIENFFEYKLQARKIVVSNNIVKLVSYTLQYLGIVMQYSIVAVPVIRCIGSLIRMALLKYMYIKEYRKDKKGKLDKNLLQDMMKESFYLWASYISFLMYTQLDKIMLGVLLGKEEVGIYTIGVQLADIFAIMIVPMQTSLFPKMINLFKEDYREYIKFYLKSNVLITQLYILGCFSSIFVIRIVFPYIFSKDYLPAIMVYSILTLAVLMKANGALQTGHMTLKEITKKSFYKTTAGLGINAILNYLLIKRFGINGAAMATAITQVFTIFIIDFFIKEYREQAVIQLKSFNSFYLIKILRKKL